MFTLVGVVFLRTDMTRSLETDLESSERKGVGRARKELMKNVLLGLTMSGINPALLATYTGAIASGTYLPFCKFSWNSICSHGALLVVYGTGMLEFTLFLAFVFALGVCCGVSTWFYLLLSLLKKYKQVFTVRILSLILLWPINNVFLFWTATQEPNYRINYARNGLFPSDTWSVLRQVFV